MSAQGNTQPTLGPDGVQLESPASSRPNKRSRADTLGESHQTLHSYDSQHYRFPPDIMTSVQAFDETTLRSLLLAGSLASPDVATMIRQKYQTILEEEAQTEINFDYLSKSVWKEVNITHRSKKGSEQYELSFEVTYAVENAIQHITKQIKPHSSFATKRSGLETLRKIAKTICLGSSDVIGHEVQKAFQYNTLLEDSMIRIIEYMTDEQRQTVCNAGRGEFVNKVAELIELAEPLCLLNNMSVVLGKLRQQAAGAEPESESTDDESGYSQS